MTRTRLMARPMLAGMFILGGLDAVRHPETKAPKAEEVKPLAGLLGLPTETVTMVRLNGAVQLSAGVLLALGRLPRLASLALAASLVPTTYAGHRFWEEADEAQRAQQKVQFFKNVSMLGGLILAALDTGGRPSVPWRTRRALGTANRRRGQVIQEVRSALPSAA